MLHSAMRMWTRRRDTVSIVIIFVDVVNVHVKWIPVRLEAVGKVGYSQFGKTPRGQVFHPANWSSSVVYPSILPPLSF